MFEVQGNCNKFTAVFIQSDVHLAISAEQVVKCKGDVSAVCDGGVVTGVLDL